MCVCVCVCMCVCTCVCVCVHMCVSVNVPAHAFTAHFHGKHLVCPKGERPYRCTLCPATYPASQQLKRHLQSHRGEKSFLCQLCGASYTESKSLKFHMRSHTGTHCLWCYLSCLTVTLCHGSKYTRTFLPYNSINFHATCTKFYDFVDKVACYKSSKNVHLLIMNTPVLVCIFIKHLGLYEPMLYRDGSFFTTASLA